MHLLVTNEQFAEAREPRVRHFDHPASRALALSTLGPVFAARPHVGRVVTVAHVLLGGDADEAGICAQMLSSACRYGRTWSDDGVKGFVNLLSRLARKLVKAVGGPTIERGR